MTYSVYKYEPLSTDPVVTLDEIKNYLRIENNLDDGFLMRLYNARLRWLEAFSGKTLRSVNVGVYYFYPSKDKLYLPYEPLDSLIEIEGSDGKIYEPQMTLHNMILIPPEALGLKFLRVEYNTKAVSEELLVTLLLMLIAYDYQSRDAFSIHKEIKDETLRNFLSQVRKVRL